MSLNKNKYLTDSEYRRLMEILEKHENDRDSLMLQLLLATGARACEFLAITFDDLNLDQRTILIHGSKGSNDREIPIRDDLFRRLISFCHGKENNERIFDIGYHRLRDIWDWHRPVKKKLHSLRHTFAIRTYKKTKDIRLVQRALGHKYLSTTLIYQDYQYGIDEMRKIL